MQYANRWLAAAAAPFVLVGAAWAAQPEEPEEPDEQERAQLETKLEAARERLEAAAREVAELSGRLTGPIAHDYFITAHMERRAVLGINIGAAPEGGPAGVAVKEVVPEGPAARAGIQAGDILVAVDGKSLKDNKQLGEALVQHMRTVKPGDTVKLEYLREGKKRAVEVTAGTMKHPIAYAMPGHRWMGIHPGHPPIPPGAPDAPLTGTVFGHFPGEMLDMELVTLTPKLGRYFGAESGVLVVRAPSDSTFRLEEGDVILDIDGREPKSGVHAIRILRSYAPDETLTVTVLRDRKKLKLTATVPQPDRPELLPAPAPPPSIKPPPRQLKIPKPPPRDESK